MVSLDEVLAAMPDEASVPYEYLTIDAEKRRILVPEAEEIFGVEADEVAERKYFRCPRYVGDNLDLAGMFLTVYFRNANGDEDGYLVDDVAVDGDDITFSWLLSEKVTAYKGQIQFSVCADLPNTETKRRPDWNTTLAAGTVLEGLDPDVGDVEAGSSDVLTQLRETVQAQTAAVEAVGAAQIDAVEAAGANATQEAKDAVKAQGAATLATIPEDYTALAGTVDKLTRDRAAAIVCEAEGTAIQVNDASNDPLIGLRIFGRSTQNGTPTPDAPVEIESLPAPVVTVCGKNLLTITAETRTMNGVTFTVHDNGEVYVKGTATEDTFFELSLLPAGVLPGVRYLLSGCAPGGGDATYYLRVSDRLTQAFDDYGGGQVFRYADVSNLQVAIRVRNGATVSGVLFAPMIRLASDTDGTYEQGKPAQTLTVTTPDGLPGIPVSSGGNYTDANGQQWVADEVDLARGVYVQRVHNIAFTGAEEELASNWFPIAVYQIEDATLHVNLQYDIVRSSHFGHVYCGNTAGTTLAIGSLDKLGFVSVDELKAFMAAQNAQGAPVVIQYVLATPIEHALTDAELQAFRALHSVKPITTVLNDAGAHMALEYAADPKTYIDNKLAALVAGK